MWDAAWFVPGGQRLGGAPAGERSYAAAARGRTDGVTHFDQLGGAGPLRLIIQDFVGRVFRDTMIGFFFARANQARIEQMEYEHAAQWLGGPVQYSGRDLRTAHGRHPIMGGHFARRRQLLDDTLRDHRVPDDIRSAWLQHMDSLREQITPDLITQCDDERASARAGASEEDDS